METKYSFKKGLVKTLINLAIIGLPLVIQILPTEIANLTLSGVLLMVINYLKVTFQD